MTKNYLSDNFEQTPHHVLPPKAVAIINSIANDLARKCRNKDLVTRLQQLDIAHAVLHMRMYQKFGTDSQDFMTHAYEVLGELSGTSLETATPGTRPLASGAL